MFHAGKQTVSYKSQSKKAYNDQMIVIMYNKGTMFTMFTILVKLFACKNLLISIHHKVHLRLINL